jgi:hypothetical protein
MLALDAKVWAKGFTFGMKMLDRRWGGGTASIKFGTLTTRFSGWKNHGQKTVLGRTHGGPTGSGVD